MKSAVALLALPLGLVVACSDAPVAPHTVQPGSVQLQQAPPKGTGLALDIVPTVTLPLGLGGSITIDQAVITNFALVENTVGQIVGLQVTGDLSGTAVNAVGGLVGVDAQPFTANLSVTSSGPGQCNLVTLDLSSLNVNALGLVTGTLPINVTGKGSGAVGSLLCNLGQALAGIGSALGGGGAQGLVNALNNQIG
jgi:hypothetical protein